MYFFFYSYEMAPFTSNEWAMEDKCKGGISVNYSELCESMQHYAKKKKNLLIEHNLYPEYFFSMMIRTFTFSEENIQYLVFADANARTLLVTRLFQGFLFFLLNAMCFPVY